MHTNSHRHIHLPTVRSWTPKIAKCVGEMVDAKEALAEARQGLATYMLRDFDAHYSLWNAAVVAAATLDCLISLSYTANFAGEGAVCRPVLVKDAEDGNGRDCAFLRLRQSRHPCIRCSIPYISNWFRILVCKAPLVCYYHLVC